MAKKSQHPKQPAKLVYEGKNVTLGYAKCGEDLIKGEFNNIEVVSAGKDDHLYIFLTDESLADIVKAFVVEITKLNQAAFKAIIVPEIPKNDSGKTLYKELTKNYE